jgi:hypothetical protein
MLAKPSVCPLSWRTSWSDTRGSEKAASVFCMSWESTGEEAGEAAHFLPFSCTGSVPGRHERSALDPCLSHFAGLP